MSNFSTLKQILSGTEPGDPPLLTELGIDFSIILQQIKLIYSLDTVRDKSHLDIAHEDLNHSNDYHFSENPTKKSDRLVGDLTGPLTFILLLSFKLFISGKNVFGCIYLFTLFNCLAVHFMIENCTRNTNDLDYNYSNIKQKPNVSEYTYKDTMNIKNSDDIPNRTLTGTSSIIGYGLLPILLFSVFSSTNSFYLFLGALIACISTFFTGKILSCSIFCYYTIWIGYMGYILIVVC